MADVEFDQVGTENVEATALLVRHLADLGHRRIALVAGLEGLATTKERPRLTPIARLCREMGSSAVRLLLNQITDPGWTPRSIRLAALLVDRESCGCSFGPSV